MNNDNIIRVGISDLNIAIGSQRIRTSGLGSCVGAVIYDLSNKIAGLAHVMLPDSSLTKQDKINKFKYANTAIPILINKMLSKGAKKYALRAKLAGGAQMFQFSYNSDAMRIGPRNIEAVREQLQYKKIPIVAEDTGGNSGRTIEFNPITGKLKIRTVNKGEKYI